MNRPGRVALLCGLLIAACAHGRIQRQALPDKSYRLVCADRLTRCLTAMEEVCGQGYEIARAHEDVRYAGPREFGEPTIVSEVVARCRSERPVFGGGGQETASQPQPGDAPGAPDAAAATPGPPSAAQRCFPGATQACVGPAACKGGQQCLPDGTAFGPCDCGPAPAGAPGAEAAPPR